MYNIGKIYSLGHSFKHQLDVSDKYCSVDQYVNDCLRLGKSIDGLFSICHTRNINWD